MPSEPAPTHVTTQPLYISIIGPFSARCGGHEVKLKTRKAGAVLAYLALSETRQESRERLVGFLWSQSEEMKARASLRQILHDMRDAFAAVGFEGLQTGKLNIALAAETVRVDLLEVLEDADKLRAHKLLLRTPRLTERLFEGLDDLDPEFRIWVMAKRQSIEDRLLRGLNTGLTSPEVKAAAKQELAAAILNIDETHEEACRSIMEARAIAGDVIGALRVYKALWDLLDEEYGMEPSLETQDLVARVKLGEFERPQALARPAGMSEGPALVEPTIRQAPRIALLLSPFDMNGVGLDKAHLVTGFRHHLAACLVRFREWSVIDNASGTVNLFVDASSAAQYSLDATAYQAGPIINMVLTLRDNTRGHFVWSESFELNLESWFEAQQRIIRRLTSSLNVQLSTERLRRLASEPDVSLETYDRWLRGQALLASFHPESWNRSSRLFADATQESPDFSPIHSSIVQMENTEHFAHPGVFRDRARAHETVARAKRAVELDPVDSRAHLCLGWSYAFASRYDEAALHMRLAQELNAYDPGTLTSTAGFWAFYGETQKALALAREAITQSMSPAPIHWTYHAMVLFLAGEDELAVDAIDRLHEPVTTLIGWRAAALFHLGRKDEAIKEGRRFIGAVRSRWFGKEPPRDNAIARWLLHAQPIRLPAQWERLRDGVEGASVSTDGIKHNVW